MFHLGLLYLFLYNVISASKGVFLGSYFQKVSPFVILGYAFLIVILFFTFKEFKNLKTLFKKIISNPRTQKNILILNLSAVIGWSSFYFAVKNLEPAIVITMFGSAGPILTMFVFKYRNPENTLDRSQLITSMLILALLTFLFLEAYFGFSAVQSATSTQVLIGTALSFLCAGANVTNTIIGKELANSGWKASQIIPFRFPMLAVFGIFLSGSQYTQLLSVQGSIAILVIALLGVALPVFLFQLGVEKTNPFIVALVLATMPLFALVAQLFDPRLTLSYFSIFGALSVAVISILYIATKEYKNSLSKPQLIVKKQESIKVVPAK